MQNRITNTVRLSDENGRVISVETPTAQQYASRSGRLYAMFDSSQFDDFRAFVDNLNTRYRAYGRGSRDNISGYDLAPSDPDTEVILVTLRSNG